MVCLLVTQLLSGTGGNESKATFPPALHLRSNFVLDLFRVTTLFGIQMEMRDGMHLGSHAANDPGTLCSLKH